MFNNKALVCVLLVGLAVPVLAQTNLPQTARTTSDKVLKEFLALYEPYQRTSSQSLSEANRSSRELQVWVSDKMAEILSVDPKTAGFKLNQSRAFFSPDAYNNYLMALGSLPYAEQLRNGQVQLSAVVNSTPALLSSGSVAGRYIWVFEINVLITAVTTKSSIVLNGPKSIQTTYRIQLARSLTAPPPHNVVFDIWQTRSSNAEQPKTEAEQGAASVVVN